jgi:hypothetical protein
MPRFYRRNLLRWHLLADDKNARAVASATRLPEELILEAIAAGRLRLRNGPPQTVVFHGHCTRRLSSAPPPPSTSSAASLT